MSEASRAFARKRILDSFADIQRSAEAADAERRKQLADHPGYQAMLADPAWKALERERAKIIARYDRALAPYRGERFYEDFGPDEQAMIDDLHGKRSAELNALARKALDLQRDYGIPAVEPTPMRPSDLAVFIKLSKTFRAAAGLPADHGTLLREALDHAENRGLEIPDQFPGEVEDLYLRRLRRWAKAPEADGSADVEGAQSDGGQGNGGGERNRPATPTVKPLTESQQEAFDLIVRQGPMLGRQVVDKLGIASESTFTRHYVPALKLHGILNRHGLGYYHPEHYSPNTNPRG